mgnify:CR=1 FL=1
MAVLNVSQERWAGILGDLHVEESVDIDALVVLISLKAFLVILNEMVVLVSSFEASVTMRLCATLVSVKARHSSMAVGFKMAFGEMSSAETLANVENRSQHTWKICGKRIC